MGEIIADNLKGPGWSWGRVSPVDSNGQTIWIVDAHRGDGKRFVVRGDEKLTAFLELESVIRAPQWQSLHVTGSAFNIPGGLRIAVTAFVKASE